MPDKKISELSAHTAPLPADLLAIVTAGVTKKISLANLWAALFSPEGTVINGKIVPSVDSNNLTVALKGMDGNDPSATNPVYVRIGGVVRAITSALTTGSMSGGTNWVNLGSAELATKEVDLFVYLSWNSVNSRVDILSTRIPGANVLGDLTYSNTAENGFIAAGATITNTATDQLVCIGRFAATLSAGAGYTWSVPTFTASNLIQRPIYETRWLDWILTPTWAAVTPPSGSPTIKQIYKISYNTLHLNVFNYGYTAGSAVTGVTFPTPITSEGTQAMNGGIYLASAPNLSVGYVRDNSLAYIFCAAASSDKLFMSGEYKF